MSAFAAEKSDAKQGDKKNVKRGVFGLGYGGYGGGYSSFGYGGLGGFYGGHGGYGGYGSHGYSAYSAPAHYSAHIVQPHTHTHSVETKVVAQVSIDACKSILKFHQCALQSSAFFCLLFWLNFY